MFSKNDSNSAALQRLIDCSSILMGFWVALSLANWLSSRQLFFFLPESLWRLEYHSLLLVAVLCWLAVSSYSGIYNSHRAERLDSAAFKLGKTLIFWGILTTGAIFFLKLREVSRQFTLYIILISGLLILLRQSVEMVILRRMRRFGYNARTALVIGEQAYCTKVAQLLTETYPMGYRVISVPLNGTVRDTDNLIAENLTEAQDAFIVPGTLQGEQLPLRLLKQGKSVHLIPDLLDARLFRQALGDIAGIPVISLLSGSLSTSQAAAKRVFDFLGSIVFLALLLPIFAILGAVLKASSSEPILFGHKRLGTNGKEFTMYKFRTMVPNAEKILREKPELYARYVANNFKLPKGEDPRITRIGAFLRATSLDELPQLFNVLNGDMSLVGPRPVVPAEVSNYGDYASLFLSAKPGMTGHWQVSGRSEVAEYARRVELDLEYIRDRSLAKDFEILLRTVPSVIRRKGAH